MGTEEEEKKAKKKSRNKIFTGLAICIAVFLIFTIGFKAGSTKGMTEGAVVCEGDSYTDGWSSGYDACLLPVLDAAYSAEGDDLATLRTDKWDSAEAVQSVVLDCDVIEEIDLSDGINLDRVQVT